MAKPGVLLINLGTPDAPTPGAIRRFLREFLSDPRVVDLPRALWLPLLYIFVLPFRPYRLAHAYRAIWSAEGSPLLAIARRQAAALEKTLGIPVVIGMRYGNPSLASALEELSRRSAQRVIVLPLYPQYSASTTAAALDGVAQALRQVRAVPELVTVNGYHADPAYIAALEESVRARWKASGGPQHLLMSFHGIPQRGVDGGDPYESQCRETARLLAEKLQLGDSEWTVCFQSRFGKAQWVQPYTEEVLAGLAARGVREVDVICPGFSADCLETLEEISLRMRARFTAAGGTGLHYIPALNDTPAHIAALAGLVRGRIEDTPPSPAARLEAPTFGQRRPLPQGER